MKRFSVVLIFSLIVLLGGFGRAYAGETDMLIQKLVEKGVITAGEAQELSTETKQEAKKQMAQGTYDMLPPWVQTTKFKGDFRLRYEYLKDENQEDENRTRIRVRFGLETRPNDQMKIGIGIATGKLSDPRSTNVTLGTDSSSSNDPGSFKDISLEYAYGQYSPASWITLLGGKFKNPLWQPTDILWDTDLNPEGIAAVLSYKPTPEAELFMNGLYFFMNQNARAVTSDASMIGLQPGVSYALSPDLNLKGAVAFYFFNKVKGMGKFTKQSTNTLTRSNYKYNYDSVNPSIELAMTNPFSGFVPYASIFTDYIQNSDNPSTGDTGYDFGVKFGYDKVADKGQWKATAMYGKLERDAFLDIFPDSDRYSGKTNMESYEAILEIGLGKNTTLVFDYYDSKSLSLSSGSYLPNQTLQVDWNLKF